MALPCFDLISSATDGFRIYSAGKPSFVFTTIEKNSRNICEKNLSLLWIFVLSFRRFEIQRGDLFFCLKMRDTLSLDFLRLLLSSTRVVVFVVRFSARVRNRLAAVPLDLAVPVWYR